jgi:SWI/SNF-related matrix-associated actin-dependent regulator of chromatin subfamily A-like protein 1
MNTAAPNNAALERAEDIAASLYPHQVEGVAFLLGRRRSLLTDDMGLGKTRQSIIAMTEAEPTGPYLVVCPASVKRNWVREIEMVLPDAETHIVGPSPLPPPDFSSWVVINYDILGKHLEGLSQFNWSGMVFDEAHYLKNYRSQRSRNASKLVKTGDSEPVVHALTGTPLTSRPRDLFPLLQLINHPLGKSFLSFAKRYCAAYQGEYGLVADGASNIEELTVQLHGVMLRRTKDEVLDLPPKFRTWLEIDLHPVAIEHFNKAVREFLLTADESLDPFDAPENEDSEEHQRQRRAVGQLTVARRKLAFAKCRHTIKVVENAVEQGEKVIVFSAFLNTLERFIKHFGAQAVAVSGEVPPEERQNRVDRFQTDENIRIFLANIHVGGVGLNLTAARQVVFNDLDWVPANHWQAEDRAYRIGQTASVNVTYMIANGTIDEFVKTVLETKAQLMTDLVEGKALGGDLQTDVIGELKRMMRTLAVQLNDTPKPEDDEKMISMLREASTTYIEENASHLSETSRQKLLPYSLEAVRALAKVLAGPERTVYRVASSSKPGTFYQLEVVGADVICSCPGFTHRGSCRHVRPLKNALVRGKPLPKGYTKADSSSQ